jgi:hypothetical protein
MVPQRRIVFALLLVVAITSVGGAYVLSLHNLEECREFDRTHSEIAAECPYLEEIRDDAIFLLEVVLLVPLIAGYLWSRNREITAHRRLARSPTRTLLWWVVAATPLLVGLSVLDRLTRIRSGIPLARAESPVDAARYALTSLFGTHLDIPFAMALEFLLFVLVVCLYVHALVRFEVRERVPWLRW